MVGGTTSIVRTASLEAGRELAQDIVNPRGVLLETLSEHLFGDGGYGEVFEDALGVFENVADRSPTDKTWERVGKEITLLDAGDNLHDSVVKLGEGAKPAADDRRQSGVREGPSRGRVDPRGRSNLPGWLNGPMTPTYKGGWPSGGGGSTRPGITGPLVFLPV
jgi:hypothetical protein